ncbi:MAG TPA: hypothetical protein DCE80_00305, partial [Ignavibacteriales bacterium]|nr:hypothetical protein [Ignavibacteriales bacterium]
HEYDAAEYLQGIIGRESLENRIIILLNRFQEKISKKLNLAEWMALIAKMGLSGIITTNWDTLLSKITGFKQIHWPEQRGDFLAALKNNEPFVLYLHGSVDRKPLVITHQDKVAAQKKFEEYKSLLAVILSIHYLIILGYSFPDEHINEVFTFASNLAGPHSQLRIILTKQADKDKYYRDVPKVHAGSTTIEYKEYRAFKEAFIDLTAQCDPSSRLILIPKVTSIDSLYDIVALQSFEYNTTSLMRTLYTNKSSNKRLLLNMSAEFIIENNLKDARSCGLFATVLNTISEHWEANRHLLTKLNQICNKALAQEDSTLSGIIEPLSFALALKGLPSAHKKYLRTVVYDNTWRAAQIKQSHHYYGSIKTQIDAIMRHLNDTRRKGKLVEANDIVRLLTLFATEPKDVAFVVQGLLLSSLNALYAAGEKSYATRIKNEVRKIAQKRDLTAGT